MRSNVGQKAKDRLLIRMLRKKLICSYIEVKPGLKMLVIRAAALWPRKDRCGRHETGLLLLKFSVTRTFLEVIIDDGKVLLADIAVATNSGQANFCVLETQAARKATHWMLVERITVENGLAGLSKSQMASDASVQKLTAELEGVNL